jgi:hypothetical protein
MWRAAPCNSPFFWCRSLSAVYFCRLCLLKGHVEFRSLLLPLPLVCSNYLALSSACPFQFLFYYSGFFVLSCGAGVSLSRGLCWFIPGELWEYHMSLICSPVCLHLPSRFGAGVSWCGNPMGFLSVTWHGEALYGLGVWGVWFLLRSMAPVSQQDFWFTKLTLSASSL